MLLRVVLHLPKKQQEPPFFASDTIFAGIALAISSMVRTGQPCPATVPANPSKNRLSLLNECSPWRNGGLK
jgi:hypothetical protein